MFNYFTVPPIKLRGSNVFSRACPSFCSQGWGGGSHVAINHDAWDFTVQSWDAQPQPLPPANARCQNIQI